MKRCYLCMICINDSAPDFNAIQRWHWLQLTILLYYLSLLGPLSFKICVVFVLKRFNGRKQISGRWSCIPRQLAGCDAGARTVIDVGSEPTEIAIYRPALHVVDENIRQ